MWVNFGRNWRKLGSYHIISYPHPHQSTYLAVFAVPFGSALSSLHDPKLVLPHRLGREQMDQIETLCCEHEHDVGGQTMLLVHLGRNGNGVLDIRDIGLIDTDGNPHFPHRNKHQREGIPPARMTCLEKRSHVAQKGPSIEAHMLTLACWKPHNMGTQTATTPTDFFLQNLRTRYVQ